MLQKFPAFVGLVPIQYAKADVLHVERDAVSRREKQKDRAKQSEDETHFVARELNSRHAKAQVRDSQLRAQLGALTPARAGARVDAGSCVVSWVAEAFAPVSGENSAFSR